MSAWTVIHLLNPGSLTEEGLGQHEIISFQHFVAVWNRDLKRITIPKVHVC